MHALVHPRATGSAPGTNRGHRVAPVAPLQTGAHFLSEADITRRRLRVAHGRLLSGIATWALKDSAAIRTNMAVCRYMPHRFNPAGKKRRSRSLAPTVERVTNRQDCE